ncbi:8928_t:CDS:2 [Funneliformis caledonium]|uniref:8928_t:CDS:1 n=1 Tax=Funneliformis caledonium TaxID=1117310 RepID=A0A9N9DZN4_9GLOM|nr:8928_t:CDS:2 [Funneliformis caledonium]
MLHKESKQRKLKNALADWLVTDSQPFNLANGEGFLHMINKLDLAFKPPCYVTIKKNIGYEYQVAFQAIKEMITHTCYIGITCHWLTENMELYDILICVALINYFHNGNNICQTILTKLQLLGLDSKVLLNLCLENEFKKDYEKLRTRILLDYEWILLKKLIVLFKPIEEAIEWLGGQKYCTLSLIYPSIYALYYDYILNIDNNIINESNEDSEDNKSVLDDKESDDNNNKKQIFSNNTQMSLSEINNIINSIKKAIYDVLFEYFNSPSLLDSRFKKMYE